MGTRRGHQSGGNAELDALLAKPENRFCAGNRDEFRKEWYEVLPPQIVVPRALDGRVLTLACLYALTVVVYTGISAYIYLWLEVLHSISGKQSKCTFSTVFGYIAL